MLLHWVYYLLLLAVQLAGLFIVILGLPGLWVMVLAAALYAWGTHGAHVGGKGLVFLVVVAAAAEVVEFIAGAGGAKKAGASKAGVWGAIVGALLGGFFLTFIPIPIVSTIIGVCLGAFLGAIAGELLAGREVVHSVNVGVGAAKGRFLGMMAKLSFGVLILVSTLWLALPTGAKATAKPLPGAGATSNGVAVVVP
jgi:uncharacterized protein YqgC (DUF456 family)